MIMAREALHPPTPGQPLWLPEMKSILDKVDMGLITRSRAPSAVANEFEKLILARKVPDLGQIGLYLWARDSPVLAYAQPFLPIEGSGFVCIDYVTGEDREFILRLPLADKARELLGNVSIHSHAQILTEKTGVGIQHGWMWRPSR